MEKNATRIGYMDIIVRDKEGGPALKVERIIFDNVVDALLEMQLIKLHFGGGEE